MGELLSNMVDRADEAITAIKDVVKVILGNGGSGLVVVVEHEYSIALPESLMAIAKVEEVFPEGFISHSQVLRYLVTKLAGDTLVFFRPGGYHIATLEHGSVWNLIVNGDDNWKDAFLPIREDAIETRQRVIKEYREILVENGIPIPEEPSLRERFHRHYDPRMVVETEARIGEGQHVIYFKKFSNAIRIAPKAHYKDNKKAIDMAYE